MEGIPFELELLKVSTSSENNVARKQRSVKYYVWFLVLLADSAHKAFNNCLTQSALEKFISRKIHESAEVQ